MTKLTNETQCYLSSGDTRLDFYPLLFNIHLVMPLNLSNTPTKHQPRRRITFQDAEAIASQVAKRMTETEAAYNLDIEPRHWFLWKLRKKNKPKFDALITSMRAAQIKAHLENIEDAERGRNGHRPDWRASDRLLSYKSPDRFGPIAQPANSQTMSIIGDDALRQILDKMFKPMATIDCPTTAPAIVDTVPIPTT